MPEDWTSTDGREGALSGTRDPLRGSPAPDPNLPWQVLTATGPTRTAPAAPVPRAADVTVRVSTHTVRRVVRTVIGSLIVLDFLAAFLSAGNLLPYFFLRFFDADQKLNFPTGAKTTSLLLITLLMLGCWVASRHRDDPGARGWLLLACGTAFAFIDETTYLHQSISTTMTNSLHLTGVLKYSWTVIYAPAAAVVAVFIVKDFRTMAPEVRRRLLPGGLLFIAGALCLEPVKASLATSEGEDSLAFRLAAALSDSLELTGLGILVVTMVIALGRQTARFGFALGEADASAAGDPVLPQEAAAAVPAAPLPAAPVDPYPVFGQTPAPEPAPAADPYLPPGSYGAPRYNGGLGTSAPHGYDAPSAPQQPPAHDDPYGSYGARHDLPRGDERHGDGRYDDGRYDDGRYDGPASQGYDARYLDATQFGDTAEFTASPIPPRDNQASGPRGTGAMPSSAPSGSLDDDPLWAAPTNRPRRRPTSGSGW